MTLNINSRRPHNPIGLMKRFPHTPKSSFSGGNVNTHHFAHSTKKILLLEPQIQPSSFDYTGIPPNFFGPFWSKRQINPKSSQKTCLKKYVLLKLCQRVLIQLLKTNHMEN